MTYSPLVGENVYDVAGKLYVNNPMAGVQDLIKSNPTIDLNASDLNGTTLTYNILTTPLTTTPRIPIIQPLPSYVIASLQTIYDLAVQLYGDVNKISLLLSNFSNINSELSGTISFSSNSPVYQYFFDRKLIVQTNFLGTGLANDFILRQDGGYLLRQDGGRFPRQT